jgi:hypothetical protein
VLAALVTQVERRKRKNKKEKTKEIRRKKEEISHFNNFIPFL